MRAQSCSAVSVSVAPSFKRTWVMLSQLRVANVDPALPISRGRLAFPGALFHGEVLGVQRLVAASAGEREMHPLCCQLPPQNGCTARHLNHMYLA